MFVRAAALALVATLALSGASSGAAHAQAPRGGAGDQISLPQFLQMRGRIFDRIDANHDGVITKDEVTAFQARMEAAAAGATIRSGRERPEGGGQIERLAELTAAGPVTRIQWDAMLTKRFQRLDAAGTGYITRDQMRGGARAAMAGQAAAPTPPMPASPPAPPQP